MKLKEIERRVARVWLGLENEGVRVDYRGDMWGVQNRQPPMVRLG